MDKCGCNRIVTYESKSYPGVTLLPSITKDETHWFNTGALIDQTNVIKVDPQVSKRATEKIGTCGDYFSGVILNSIRTSI